MTAEQIIADHLGLDLSEATPEATLCEDLGADSLDIIEIAMELEEVFKVIIPEEDYDTFIRVKDVTSYLDGLLGR